MADLETRLRAMRDEVAWPAAPALADGVVARLDAEPAPARRPRPVLRRPRLAVLVALLVLVPAAGAIAFPSVRDDVLEWLGVKGAEVRREPELPPAQVPGLDDLGALVTLEEAERQAGFDVVVPSGLGEPDDVRYDRVPNVVTLVYERPDGPILVAQVPGALDRQLLQKVIGPGTGVEEVDVDGDPGIHMSGARHVYLYLRPDGSVVEDEPRLAGDTLIFSRGNVLFRIESAELPLDTALQIARSLRE